MLLHSAGKKNILFLGPVFNFGIRIDLLVQLGQKVFVDKMF